MNVNSDFSQNEFVTEQKSRENLAALYRLYSKFGWTDLNQTHAAARVPGRPDLFLSLIHI